jgi:putative DNA primase/helicase
VTYGYKAWAATYLSLGWSPIPLPAREKFPPPDHAPRCKCPPGRRGEDGKGCRSYTGAAGKYVDAEDVRAWTGAKATARSGKMTFPPGNIGLRLPPNVVGIDVDTYGDKAGAGTIRAAEQKWGKLPATWISCNRIDTPLSGIRLYRLSQATVDANLAWPESLKPFFGGGVELIRPDHRFVVCAPSVHDEGRTYFWRMPDGTVVDLAAIEAAYEQGNGADIEVELPDIESLPLLSAAWITGLTGDKPRIGGERGGAGADLNRGEVEAWIAERTETLGEEMCNATALTLARYRREIRIAGDDGGVHDVARDGSWALIGDSAAGHAGIEKALADLRASFFAAVRGRRGSDNRIAGGEWERMVIRGVTRVAAEGEGLDIDRCNPGAVPGSPPPARGRRLRQATSAFEYTRDDRGNARRLYDRCGNGKDVRWCSALGGWHLWNAEKGIWELDPEGIRMKAIFTEVVDDMQVEVEEADITNEKAREALLRFVHSCGNMGRIATAVEALKLLPGIEVSADVFDANPRILGCSNGVIELTRTGALFRPANREDYLTAGTGIEYRPDADVALIGEASRSNRATRPAGVDEGAALWESFTGACMPDPGLRAWVQKAVGYSLLGGNPERLMFVVEGQTSSGKSTFVEAIRSMFGGYASAFNFSLFRSEKEQGSNVALVRLLPKRFIVASEASQNQHLHADEVKRLTGGDAATARLNNANTMVERVPHFTPWIATNAAPAINGADSALYRRLRTVPFDETIAEGKEDADLGEKLRTVALPAILCWAVRGWDRYCTERLGALPAPVEQATLRMRGELSEFAVWLTARTEKTDEEAFVTTDELYEDYERWAEANNVKLDSKIAFGRSLSRNGYVQKREWTGPKSSGPRPRGWVGIRLKR